jgi:hypothetical protein
VEEKNYAADGWPTAEPRGHVEGIATLYFINMYIIDSHELLFIDQNYHIIWKYGRSIVQYEYG